MNISKTVKSKIEQLIRLIFINSIAIRNDSVLLVEYPKSGGTWLGQLISAYLDIPFPRNQLPSLKRSLYHSHYLPKYNILRNKNILYLIRDGRDAMISLYYHQLIWNEKNKLNPKDVHYHRSKVPFDDYDNIEANLAAFIKYTFENKPSKWQQFTYMGNWAEYNNKWVQVKHNNLFMIKYEDLLTQPLPILKNLLESVFNLNVDAERLNQIINQFSFENQTKRNKGEEKKSSFLRKGISGDWKNYFGTKEKELFKKYAGDTLIKLGYESDNQW